MPNPQDVATNLGANFVLGRAGQALGAPLPTFQELQMIRHGQGGRAARHMGGRVGGRYAGGAAGAIVGGPIGAWLGGMAGSWFGGHVVPWISGHGWNDDQGYDQQGTVGGQPAQLDQQGNPTAGGVTIDPWTGQQVQGGSGLPNYMPNFTGGQGYSQQGPYAGGYQGLPDDGSGGNATLPDFSDYSTQFVNPELDSNGDGRVTPNERRENDWQRNGPNALGMGVSNFMVGGSNVINGVRPAGYDPNQMAMMHRDYGN